jgi:alpha/beta superfamily hydrolase
MPEVIFPGPEGRIEGRYHQSQNKSAPLALILHPHPLYGGTMNNKVVYHLFHAFVRQGFTTLRFNFRGVGRSQGKFDDGVGELSDAAAALDWMQLKNPDAKACWVAGFSFGAWVSMQLLMRRPEIEGFVSVSPPANIYDFAFLAPCPASGLILQGASDDIVTEESVAKLAKKLSSQRGITVDYEVVPGADHYYRETLEEMNHRLDAYLVDRANELKDRKKLRPERRRRQSQRA